MTAVGVGVADASHYGELPVVPQLLERGHRGMKTELGVEREHAIRGDGQRSATRLIGAVAVRNHGIEAIVSAVERHEDNDAGRPTTRLDLRERRDDGRLRGGQRPTTSNRHDHAGGRHRCGGTEPDENLTTGEVGARGREARW